MSMTTPTTHPIAAVSKTSRWAGGILSGLAVALFVVTGLLSLLMPAAAAHGFAHYGYANAAVPFIAVVKRSYAPSSTPSRKLRFSARFF